MYKSVLSTFVLLFSCMISIAQTDDFLQSEVSYTKLDENPLDTDGISGKLLSR